jgi:putative ABC transport system permease protein
MLIFPGMFLTFGSMIMIGALLVLYALFKDLAGKRAHEWGILRAVGVTRKDLLISGSYEALWPILFGSGLGLVIGYIIGGFLNIGLGSAWSNSVEDASVPFTISGATIVISIAATVLLSFLIVFISVFREARRAPIANIRDRDPTVVVTGRWMRIRAYTAVIILLAGSIGILFFGSDQKEVICN